MRISRKQLQQMIGEILLDITEALANPNFTGTPNKGLVDIGSTFVTGSDLPMQPPLDAVLRTAKDTLKNTPFFSKRAGIMQRKTAKHTLKPHAEMPYPWGPKLGKRAKDTLGEDCFICRHTGKPINENLEPSEMDIIKELIRRELAEIFFSLFKKKQMWI